MVSKSLADEITNLLYIDHVVKYLMEREHFRFITIIIIINVVFTA